MPSIDGYNTTQMTTKLRMDGSLTMATQMIDKYALATIAPSLEIIAHLNLGFVVLCIQYRRSLLQPFPDQATTMVAHPLCKNQNHVSLPILDKLFTSIIS